MNISAFSPATASFASCLLEQATSTRAFSQFLDNATLYNTATKLFETCIAPSQSNNGSSGSPPPPPPQEGNEGGLNTDRLIALVVCLGLALVLALVIAGWLVFKSKHRTLLGTLKRPGLGPETTLLVTDIEGSTALWEELPPGVMDEALKLHHDVIRRTCQRYNAYPSATEGDSWIVAFHTSVDSVLAAAEIQEALLAAEWPDELLQIQRCAPVYLGPHTRGPSAAETATPSMHTFKAALSATGRALHLSWRGNSSHGKMESAAAAAAAAATATASSSPGPRRRWSETGRIASHGSLAGSEAPDRLSSMRTFKEALTATSKVFHFGSSGIAPDSTDWKGMFTVLDQAVNDSIDSRASGRSLSGNPTSHSGNDRDRSSISRLVRAVTALPSSVAGSSEHGHGPGQGQALPFGMTDSVVGVFESHGRYVAAPSLLSHLERCYCAYDAPGPGRSLVWRGLRVRMGAHSGLHEPRELNFNRSTGRWQYSGSFLAITRAVQSAAHGGMVLISGECFRQLTYGATADKKSQEALRSHCVLLAAGDHEMCGDGGAGADEGLTLNLYQLVQHRLALRAMVLGPLRHAVQLSAGFLSAPVGSAAVCYMNCVGTSSLLAWNAEVTKSSLALMHTAAGQQLYTYGGYLLDTSETLGLLVAFPCPAAAIRWALNTIEILLHADWPLELLAHELGEEVGVSVADPLHRNMHAASYKNLVEHMATGRRPSANTCRVEGHMGTRTVLLRGLRMKCGIDLGRNIRLGINEISGRIAIFGKCMNRAARITSMTKTGQVWCSSDTWDAAYAAVNHASLTGGSNAAGLTPPNSAAAGHQPLSRVSNSITGEHNMTDGERSSDASQVNWPCGSKRVAATDLGPFKLRGIEREMQLIKVAYDNEGAQPLALPTVRSGRQDNSFQIKPSGLGSGQNSNSVPGKQRMSGRNSNSVHGGRDHEEDGGDASRLLQQLELGAKHRTPPDIHPAPGVTVVIGGAEGARGTLGSARSSAGKDEGGDAASPFASPRTGLGTFRVASSPALHALRHDSQQQQQQQQQQQHSRHLITSPQAALASHPPDGLPLQVSPSGGSLARLANKRVTFEVPLARGAAPGSMTSPTGAVPVTAAAAAAAAKGTNSSTSMQSLRLANVLGRLAFLAGRDATFRRSGASGSRPNSANDASAPQRAAPPTILSLLQELEDSRKSPPQPQQLLLQQPAAAAAAPAAARKPAMMMLRSPTAAREQPSAAALAAAAAAMAAGAVPFYSTGAGTRAAARGNAKQTGLPAMYGERSVRGGMTWEAPAALPHGRVTRSAVLYAAPDAGACAGGSALQRQSRQQGEASAAGVSPRHGDAARTGNSAALNSVEVELQEV